MATFNHWHLSHEHFFAKKVHKMLGSQEWHKKKMTIWLNFGSFYYCVFAGPADASAEGHKL